MTQHAPTRTKRPAASYTRLEQHRATILCPATGGALLSDDSPVGTHPVEGEGIRW